MEMKICQSCGMPLQEDEQFGKNADGTKNESYCCYCLKDGNMDECTMEEMAEFCAPFEVEGGRSKDIAEAKSRLMEYLPTLDRWKK